MSTDLGAALTGYLELRRGMGYSLAKDKRLLTQFIIWLEQHRKHTVTIDDAITWARLTPCGSRAQVGKRLQVVRGLAGYLHMLDPAHEVPPRGLMPIPVSRAVPYLYSDADIAALLAGVARLRTPLRRATITTAIDLLTVTGMRVGELVGLDDTDFDPDRGVLTVRRAKLGKHRLLPLHPGTVTALAAYRSLREETLPHPRDPALLLTRTGARLRTDDIGHVFVKLARWGGLTPRSPRCRPRPHDLRHTFAVNTVLDWYRDGGDIAARMPLLSTYLGHVDPSGTYWYLEAAPELLAHAACRLETGSGEIGGAR